MRSNAKQKASENDEQLHEAMLSSAIEAQAEQNTTYALPSTFGGTRVPGIFSNATLPGKVVATRKASEDKIQWALNHVSQDNGESSSDEDETIAAVGEAVTHKQADSALATQNVKFFV